MPKSKAVPQVTSKVRHRRKKSEMPFADALSAATKRLSHATKEREQAQKSLTSLNAEIPNLQRTIQALQVQLKPSAVNRHLDAVHISEIGSISTEQLQKLKQRPIAGGLLEGVTLPAEDLTGMGSTRAVDEDVLPDAEGQEVIPE